VIEQQHTPLPLHCSDLRRYLLAIAERLLSPQLRPKGGASDIVQDTLAAAHVAREQCEAMTPKQFRGWLRKILINVIRQFRRRWQECQSRDASLEVPLSDRAHLGLPAPNQERPSAVADRNEMSDRIKDALAQLPEDQARAVVLRMENPDASWEEIGQAIGMGPDAARMQVNRGLQKLRALLRGVDT
jgi:RNA polymerase sigma-70 factor (ECF subfamily)